MGPKRNKLHASSREIAEYLERHQSQIRRQQVGPGLRLAIPPCSPHSTFGLAFCSLPPVHRHVVLAQGYLFVLVPTFLHYVAVPKHLHKQPKTQGCSHANALLASLPLPAPRRDRRLVLAEPG